ncbi:hypothetical protein SUNI508_06062 [Seiridium unicorne]|uniref:Glycine-rich cell wall structural protein 1 n=1 Tax=Seiridium unicorne TaxID=138068 RepID=A0ABR2V3T2_9PEZI
METINGIATAAAKAVWGENTTDGKEPVSGQQGDTSVGEPFDKGNAEEPQSTTSTIGQTGTHTDTSKSTSGEYPDRTAGTSTTGASTSSTGDNSKPAEFAKSTGTAAESSDVPDNKQTELKSKDTPADTSKGQNDVRDPEDPQTNPKNNPTDVDNTEEGINKGQKLDGAGPKPLTEVAKEHGGDAGNSATKSTSGEGESKEAAGDSDDPNDPRAPSKGEGTGEKYVKSSGLHADGGDFDATNPGAGREADRLLEEKGIHVDKGDPKGPSTDDTTTSSTGAEDKEKKSLKDKIKDKLHRH